MKLPFLIANMAVVSLQPSPLQLNPVDCLLCLIMELCSPSPLSRSCLGLAVTLELELNSHNNCIIKTIKLLR